MMRLIELKEYLQQRPQVPLVDIAHHFDTEPDVVRGMLDHWVRKGKVLYIQGVACNKGCCRIDPANLEIYQWIET